MLQANSSVLKRLLFAHARGKEAGEVTYVRSDSQKMVNLYEVPIEDVKRLLDVLQNDLKEYEQLDEDFGQGTEATLKRFVDELSRHLE